MNPIHPNRFDHYDVDLLTQMILTKAMRPQGVTHHELVAMRLAPVRLHAVLREATLAGMVRVSDRALGDAETRYRYPEEVQFL
jgi:hypothetical protein